jgi:hypothetical protein
VYYGHHQFMQHDDRRIRLGSLPNSPINDFRAGEKLVVRDGDWQDFSARVRVCVVDGRQDAGLLLRTTACSLGYDAQKGYFAGIIPTHNRIILGATDGVDGVNRSARIMPPAVQLALSSTVFCAAEMTAQTDIGGRRLSKSVGLNRLPRIEVNHTVSASSAWTHAERVATSEPNLLLYMLTMLHMQRFDLDRQHAEKSARFSA